MIYRYQSEQIFRQIKAFFMLRPLVIPALIALLAINIYVNVKSSSVNVNDAEFYGYVRHIDYNLDGTVELEIVTDSFGRLLYKTFEDYPDVGQDLYIRGDIYMPDPPSNPGEFDYAGYLKRRGIRGILKPDAVDILNESNLTGRLASFAGTYSYKLRCFALSLFDEGDKALAAAVFMGDSSLVEDYVLRAFRLSNCSHLLAVSGTHFAGFLMILASVVSASHMKKRYSGPLYIAFCILVGTFTGWSGSVTRAAVMSICAFMCRDYLSGMALATIMIFVEDPYGCLSSGYMMSFAASLSIHYLSGGIHKKLTDIRIPDKTADILSPSFAAVIGMMPFWERSCYYFSFVHLFVQIAGSFIATAACVFFVPSVITGLPHACSFLLHILLNMTRLCSSVSFEGASSRGLSDFFIKSLFALIVISLFPRSIIKRIIQPAVILITFAAAVFMFVDFVNSPDLTVIFIDVGQGDSCLIMNDQGSVLIDGGVEDEGHYSVSSVLDYYGIGSVDIAVATHMDEDHIGGINYLNSAGRIRRMLTCYDLKCGDEIQMDDDLILYCIWPHVVHDGGNEDSVVLRMVYNSTSILFTGDIGFDTESELIREGADLDSDILKVGHHGSAYSTGTAFLEAVSPQTAIISVVRNSPYGHPAPSTIQRLEEYGCEIRRTDLEGAIIYEFSVSE